jgi:hypothetical protein
VLVTAKMSFVVGSGNRPRRGGVMQAHTGTQGGVVTKSWAQAGGCGAAAAVIYLVLVSLQLPPRDVEEHDAADRTFAAV